MLYRFSTSGFIVVLLVLALLWYGGVLVFFLLRKNGRGLIGAGLGLGSGHKLHAGRATIPDDGTSAAGSEEIADDLMGKAKLPEGMTSVGMEDIGFVDLDERNVADQQGLVPDLLEEIKNVFLLLAKEDGSKQDFLALMKVIKENYPGMSSHPRIGAINEFIAGHAAFHIGAEELENLWY
ncbi:hypothetical protein [Pedobacter rhizosphaerae]|uniref:Uncharacterized protein n=1 Tax=Pedobacter rhizosphaerae TaxID=390241 RepID=A0A1H9T0A7_9SPHI|nr:hypothetical protein [Pedobacter rhizosphaerae]SER90159.1 hypothetical protein SAMN04488023_12015 [Pedobacter rhizosphaerae]